MKLKAIVHACEGGGYWAEVPGIPGCATEGATLEELRRNLCEAVEGCWLADGHSATCDGEDLILEISV
jgi:predicted RNase H-like HicB family nuclease